jgi:hypothetical protein
MSDISISFPPWAIAWFLLGEATPFITLVLICLAAAFFFIRGTAYTALVLWLKWAVAIVGALWLGGISFWVAGLVDRIETDIYQARHHYQLEKAAILAGIEIPAGSWVWVDEDGKPYEIEAADGATVAIDGALWRGEIRLIPPYNRKTSDNGVIKSATLAADATIQGIPCRAGTLVEFSEYGGDLQHCTLSERTAVSAEIDDGQSGDKSVRNIACATDQEIWFRTFERRLLERCVLADTAMIGTVLCAGDKEMVLSGNGLDMCTLASAQRVGPFDLSAGTLVGFTQGRLDRLETPPTSTPLAISGLDLPPGTVVHLCERSSELDWLSVPEGSYVTLAGIKLTGRMNFDCGKFQYGTLFGATVLGGRLLPRGATISPDDMLGAPPR